MSTRRLAAAVAAAALLVFAAGCDGDSAPPVSGQIRLVDFGFEPSPLRFEAGRVDVVNGGAVLHDLVIHGPGKGTRHLDPGQSQTLDLSKVEPGTYTVYCSVPGHVEAGMAAEITITG